LNQKSGRRGAALGLAAGMLISLLLPGQTTAASRIPVRHSTEYIQELNEEITKAMYLIEEVLMSDYQAALKETKQKIRSYGWDYEYTMDSFYNQGNPFTDMDYISLIAAYATIVKNGTGNYGLLAEIPFLKTSYREVAAPDGDGRYGEVTFTVMNAEDIFNYYGYKTTISNIRTEYTDRRNLLEEATCGVDPGQSIFVKTPESVSSEETDYTKFIRKIPAGLRQTNRERYDIVTTALSLLGQVPYDWGGKADSGGYDNTWWTFNETTGRQKGLDCSGFVQWVFLTLGYPKEVTDRLYWTGEIKDSLMKIRKEDLKPGDIGLKNETESGVNHTGIYLGNGLWIHCSSAGGTVVCNSGSFRYYRRAPIGNRTETDTGTRNESSGLIRFAEGTGGSYTEQDVLELAQLIEHEAGGEPYNGQIAVGEVVMNRVLDPEFPDTVHDVIFQSYVRNGRLIRQFENSQDIVKITPREEVISAARLILAGKLKVFNNTKVLYFKNPMVTNHTPASEPENWGNLPWYTYIGHHAFYLGD
jgi:hypothetical protein